MKKPPGQTLIDRQWSLSELAASYVLDMAVGQMTGVGRSDLMAGAAELCRTSGSSYYVTQATARAVAIVKANLTTGSSGKHRAERTFTRRPAHLIWVMPAEEHCE